MILFGIVIWLIVAVLLALFIGKTVAMRDDVFTFDEIAYLANLRGYSAEDILAVINVDKRHLFTRSEFLAIIDRLSQTD